MKNRKVVVLCAINVIHISRKENISFTWEIQFIRGIITVMNAGMLYFWPNYSPTQPTFTCSMSAEQSQQKMYEICSDLTIETPEWRHWHRFGVFNMNFEHSSHIVLIFPWLTFTKGIPVGLTSSCTPNVWHEDTIKMPWIFLRWKNTRRTTMGMLLASWLIFWKFGVKF